MALAERDWENAVQGLGNAKSMTSVGNSALLPANVDRQPPLQRGLIINFFVLVLVLVLLRPLVG